MRNATRRNRNIGTAKQGHGQNNKLEIPTHLYPNGVVFHFEDLKNYQSVMRRINNHPITFLVEETRDNCVHACTIDDITQVLRHVPLADLDGISLIVLRQPKRKEELIDPVWGRYVQYAVIDDFSGSTIFLEAVDLSGPIRWSKSLSPDLQAELKRLKADGHSVTTTKRDHVVSASLDSVRATQLYRTLLHEIGHHVDRKRGEESFDLKPSKEKEVFAHKYANKMREDLRQKGVIPFDRILDIEGLKSEGLSFANFEAIEQVNGSSS
jgi:hypothetical protein